MNLVVFLLLVGWGAQFGQTENHFFDEVPPEGVCDDFANYFVSAVNRQREKSLPGEPPIRLDQNLSAVAEKALRSFPIYNGPQFYPSKEYAQLFTSFNYDVNEWDTMKHELLDNIGRPLFGDDRISVEDYANVENVGVGCAKHGYLIAVLGYYQLPEEDEDGELFVDSEIEEVLKSSRPLVKHLNENETKSKKFQSRRSKYHETDSYGQKHTKTELNLNLNINNPKAVEYLIEKRNTQKLMQNLKNEARNEKQIQIVQQIETIFNQILEQVKSSESDEPTQVALKFDDLDLLRSLIYSEDSRELVQKVKNSVPEEQFNNLSMVLQAIRQGIAQV